VFYAKAKGIEVAALATAQRELLSTMNFNKMHYLTNNKKLETRVFELFTTGSGLDLSASNASASCVSMRMY
jgi:hypothetical protein